MAGITNHQKFEWYTDEIPSFDQIKHEQSERGYHPAGYGDPMYIKTIETSDDEIDKKGKYKTTWTCWGSCD